MRLVLVARYLERITDHAINVVERVNYIETGELRQFKTSLPEVVQEIQAPITPQKS